MKQFDFENIKLTHGKPSFSDVQTTINGLDVKFRMENIDDEPKEYDKFTVEIADKTWEFGNNPEPELTVDYKKMLKATTEIPVLLDLSTEEFDSLLLQLKEASYEKRLEEDRTPVALNILSIESAVKDYSEFSRATPHGEIKATVNGHKFDVNFAYTNEEAVIDTFDFSSYDLDLSPTAYFGRMYDTYDFNYSVYEIRCDTGVIDTTIYTSEEDNRTSWPKVRDDRVNWAREDLQLTENQFTALINEQLLPVIKDAIRELEANLSKNDEKVKDNDDFDR